MAKLKICGLKRVEDIDYVNELKVDYIGFILSAGYKRSIDFKTAQSLKNRLSKDIKAVGVFVELLTSTLKSLRLRLLTPIILAPALKAE